VKVSINPDDQGFFDAKGVTLDYLLVYLAWGLDLADLKELCLNSLKFASISEAEHKEVDVFFHKQWRRFLICINNL
jgi:adenosine deaminase